MRPDSDRTGTPMTRRILVVDDDDAIRDVVRTGLEVIAGWRVQLATHGAEALRLCAADPPDAVLLDVMMPTMDGPTTYARLQDDARTRDVPVIFLTAKVQPAERRQYEDLGAAGVLAKPFDPLTLPAQIATLLGWPPDPPSSPPQDG
ncbi:response regulator [Promicromonospora thailandica]|uniref:Response regulator receiver domain-containing protein n=1 Tax=Promicromonospora thailandica TaxID=765201 RepID=A0A9X2G1M5_9MICO|nr:response regulator [Promicromonospora thailandica]MCP2265405.1 Response regulator receiver domain-containing protein [Promicromonospora thailandica]BFF16943.1 response regulator [Promicromonospora thailandica]